MVLILKHLKYFLNLILKKIIKISVIQADDLDELFETLDSMQKSLNRWISMHEKYSYQYSITVSENSFYINTAVYADQED